MRFVIQRASKWFEEEGERTFNTMDELMHFIDEEVKEDIVIQRPYKQQNISCDDYVIIIYDTYIE